MNVLNFITIVTTDQAEKIFINTDQVDVNIEESKVVIKLESNQFNAEKDYLNVKTFYDSNEMFVNVNSKTFILNCNLHPFSVQIDKNELRGKEWL